MVQNGYVLKTVRLVVLLDRVNSKIVTAWGILFGAEGKPSQGADVGGSVSFLRLLLLLT